MPFIELRQQETTPLTLCGQHPLFPRHSLHHFHRALVREVCIGRAWAGGSGSPPYPPQFLWLCQGDTLSVNNQMGHCRKNQYGTTNTKNFRQTKGKWTNLRSKILTRYAWGLDAWQEAA